MPVIPLALKLRKRLHKKIAVAQDLIALQTYVNFPEAVLHGGTAIWRCYGGNRFSEDLDFYLPSVTLEQIQDFSTALKAKGMNPVKSKKTSQAVYVTFAYSDVQVRFEAILKRVRKYTVRPFETFDGTFMSVRTLSPDSMILEKIAAYKKRRKIRDLYDIYFLLEFVEDHGEIRQSVRSLLKEKVKPVDENQLKSIILTGTPPRVSDMFKAMEKWVR